MRSFLITFIPVLIICLLTGKAFSQFTVTSYQDPLKAEVIMDQFNDPYAFYIQYEEAPYPSGDDAMRTFLRQRKLEAQIKTPVNSNPISPDHRGSIPPPEILASFSGNSIITGTPLDNHLAVNAAEQIVSTINTHMLVVNNVGFWLGSYKLDVFSRHLAE